jgi:3-isopropylmalate/(R)-2-methylmalate dehydratase large subunit
MKHFAPRANQNRISCSLTVLAWAAAPGLKVSDRVTLFLQFGTAAVRDYYTARGYMQVYESVGAQILQPACGACANCGPGTSGDAATVTVNAVNQNFPSRSGPGQLWLASPPTVAASAIAGELISFEALQQQYENTTRCFTDP